MLGRQDTMDELELEAFKTYRSDSSEVMSALSIMTKHEFFNHTTHLLEISIASGAWQNIESALFLVKSGAEFMTATRLEEVCVYLLFAVF